MEMEKDAKKFVTNMSKLINDYGFLLPFLSLGKIQFMMALDNLKDDDKLDKFQKELFRERLQELIDSANGLIEIIKEGEFPTEVSWVAFENQKRIVGI